MYQTETDYIGWFIPLLTLIPVVIVALSSVQRKQVLEAFLLFNLVIWSPILHLCKGINLCLVPTRVTMILFLFFAGCTVTVLPVEFLDPRSAKLKLTLKLIIIEIVSLILFLEPKLWITCLTSSAFFFLMIILMYFFKLIPTCSPKIYFHTFYIIAGFFAFFFLIHHKGSVYWIDHSTWHIYIVFTAYFYLKRVTSPNLIYTDVGRSNEQKQRGLLESKSEV